MKILKSVFFAIITITLLQSCQQSNHATVRFDFQGGFDNDSVILKVDGNTIYGKDSVTTNNLLGFADMVSMELYKGNRAIELTVNSVVVHSFILLVEHPLYIGITYYSADSAAIFQFSEGPYLYE